MRALFRHRDARIYLIGQAFSILGDNALWLAMGIWVKILTGSNTAAGLTFFAYVCGLLLAPLGGLVADRVRRRPLLILVNLVSAVGICSLLLVGGPGQLWLVYSVMFAYGAISGLIEAAQTALLAVMLPKELLGEANSLLQLEQTGVRLVTPLVGASLLALIGPDPVILMDAGSFLVAGLSLFFLRMREPRPARSKERWSAEFIAGLRHIGQTTVLRRLQVALVAALLVFGFFQTVQFAVVDQGLHRSPVFVGVLEAATGAGALVGALFAAPIMRRTGERAMVAISLTAGGLLCPLLMTTSLPVVLIVTAVVGLCIVWVEVAAVTLIQRRTPHELLGRVSAAITTAAMIPQAISVALGAALIAVVDYRILLIVMAVAYLISAAQMVGWSESPAERQFVARAEIGLETDQ